MDVIAIKFDLKIYENQGTLYFPKEIRKILGKEIIAIPNTYTVLIFNKSAEIKKVISSLDLIKQTLLLQKEEGL